MKKKMHYVILLGALFGVASCTASYDTVDFQNVEKKIFLADRYVNEKLSRDECYAKTVTLKAHPNYEHLLYTDVAGYFDLLSCSFVDGVKMSVEKNDVIVKKDEKPIFIFSIDTYRQQFLMAGEISDAFRSEAPNYGTLEDDTAFASVVISRDPKKNYASYSYRYFNTELPTYVINGKYYAPIGLFDTIVGSSSNLYHFDNFIDIYQYSSKNALNAPIAENNEKITDNIARYNQENGMPMELRKLDKACLYFVMDNLYGLSYSRHIDSMHEYYDSLGFNNSLLDDDPTSRSYAYFDFFAVLNDDHSGLSSGASWWGDDPSTSHRGDISKERAELYYALKEQRASALNLTDPDSVISDVYYSSSGETAYFYFDGFTFEANPYIDGTQTYRDDLWKTDSYYYFLHQFEAIENHGGVKNIIIDDSCNGGGVVGIAMKLLALLSENDSGKIYFHSLDYSLYQSYEAIIDSNKDEEYDKDDVYGDDYNFYILTSPRSFSCGNLFPFMAKEHGYAKIIGQKSGGGECTVVQNFLPSGRQMAHSSTTRLVTYRNEEFYGLESGAEVDIKIPYYEFYNIDYLESLF